MVSFTSPYIIPLFLGMTFDARNTRPGVDIYDAACIDDPQTIEFGTSKSVYKITTSIKEVQDALDVSGDLSLKIKTGMIDVEGKGSYIKNERDYKNQVEILTTLDYTSKVKSFKQNCKPRPNWTKLYNAGVLGTHYVSSITYGAEMIASARFVVHNTSDTSQVKADVEGSLGSGGSGIDLVGKLDKLEKKVEGKANLEISYYGTVPLRSIPNTIKGLETLITTFKEQIDETHLKEGIPTSVTLAPLTDIAPTEDQKKFEFIKNQALEDALADFEEKFDELIKARLDLGSWAKALPYELPDAIEKEIGFLLKNITLVTEIFYEVVWQMDLTKGADQLDKAFNAYDYDGAGSYMKYDRQVRRLIAKIDPLIKRGEVASASYVHWGNKNCSATNTVLLYEGFAFSSVEEGIGGTARYECAPRSVKKGYDLANDAVKSNLAGMRYTALDKASNPFKGDYANKIAGKGVPCAKCYSPDSASIAMFPASSQCPLSWEFIYLGYLMSSRTSGGLTTEYICVDEEPSEPYKMDAQTANKDTVALTVVHSQGALPKDLFPEGGLVRCVVCSLKGISYIS